MEKKMYIRYQRTRHGEKNTDTFFIYKVVMALYMMSVWGTRIANTMRMRLISNPVARNFKKAVGMVVLTHWGRVCLKVESVVNEAGVVCSSYEWISRKKIKLWHQNLEIIFTHHQASNDWNKLSRKLFRYQPSTKIPGRWRHTQNKNEYAYTK